MIRKLTNQLLLLLGVVALVNCGAIPNSTSTNSGNQSTATSNSTESLLLGEILYADNCASCHGNIDSSDVTGASASRIQSAIDNNEGGMGFLADLTADEVQSLAEALALNTGGSNSGSYDEDDDDDYEIADDDDFGEEEDEDDDD